MHITAVSLGAAQSRTTCRPRASILDTTDERRTMVSVEWADMGPIGEGETVTEWLYNLLARLVENYDDHTVLSIQVESGVRPEEAPDAP